MEDVLNHVEVMASLDVKNLLSWVYDYLAGGTVLGHDHVVALPQRVLVPSFHHDDVGSLVFVVVRVVLIVLVKTRADEL